MALVDNKAKIQALLAGINALPEAGSGDPVLQEKSVTPTESAQTVRPDSGYDGLSSVAVGAVSSTYVGSAVPKQAAQTITPGTADKTIASDRYLTGTQTIKGDANLKAENIKSGVSIFNVLGSLEVSGGPYAAAEEIIWTPTSDLTYGAEISIPHSLGVEPDGFNIVASELDYGSSASYIVSNIVFDRSMIYGEFFPFLASFGIGNTLGESSVLFYMLINPSENLTPTHIKFDFPSGTSAQKIPAGKQYRVLVYKR